MNVEKRLADEFVEDFCRNRGGNFMHDKLWESFYAGMTHCARPHDGHHYVMAYIAGRRAGGCIFEEDLKTAPSKKLALSREMKEHVKEKFGGKTGLWR